MLAATVSGCGPVRTHGDGSYMSTYGYAFPPPGFLSFCSAEPEICSTEGTPEPVVLSDARRAELEQVNRRINRRIHERPDPSPDGAAADDWRLPQSEGDCEDFAIAKKKALLDRGWPAHSLLLTVGWLGDEGHTVLTVRTNEGDLILDNRSEAVLDWAQTPYRYFARQAAGEGSEWTRIADTPLPS